MKPNHSTHLNPDRYFDPNPDIRQEARKLYQGAAGLPIVSPHGHVDPWLFASESQSFGSPTELLILPDHYVFRMLYSQGIPMEELGIPRQDGGPVEGDHRKIWQIFAENFHLFRGTPSGVWLAHELSEVLGVQQKLDGACAQEIYDEIAEKLVRPEFQPRTLFQRFGIKVLCTTDIASDSLAAHQTARLSGWQGDLRPTLRLDSLVNIDAPGWPTEMDRLSDASGISVDCFARMLQALQQRRAFFKEIGATATDLGVTSALTLELDSGEAEAIFQRGLRRQASRQDAQHFIACMIMESARMSIEDGLVMQLHVGSLRNHNPLIFQRFGPDKGADIPIQSEFTRSLHPLLSRYGNDPRLGILLFTLDESSYSRELAPLAGHYPTLKLGPPWWFHDSLNGIARYFDRVMETAGLYNTAGFNDDTRAFLSIPARHDVWRRASANWIAGLLVRGLVNEDDAHEMMLDMAYRLALRAYRLPEKSQ